MSRFDDWLAAEGHDIEVKRYPAGTRTAADAARAIGCEVGQIVKSLVFMAGGAPVVCLVSGSNQLAPERLLALAGDPVDKATADEVRDATGYAIGGVPPFGHATSLPVFLDRDLLRYEIVWAAAGRPDSVFALTPGRLEELSGATVAELT